MGAEDGTVWCYAIKYGKMDKLLSTLSTPSLLLKYLQYLEVIRSDIPDPILPPGIIHRRVFFRLFFFLFRIDCLYLFYPLFLFFFMLNIFIFNVEASLCVCVSWEMAAIVVFFCVTGQAMEEFLYSW